MSDTYTWPQRCPDLVQDVSLKRARIDNEDGTSTIRTTSSSSTDVTAITQALGNQADTISQPSVIGLLKNLVANSGGGGGGGSVTLTVPRIQIYDPLYNNTWGTIQQIYFYDNNTQVYDFPEWADYIGFYSMQSGNLGVCKLKNNASNKIIILEINDFAYPADPGAGTSLQLYKEYIKIELQEITTTPWAPLSMTFNGWKEDWTSGTPTVYQYSNRDYSSVIPFVFSLSSFDIAGGGGGGSGEAISTYNLTINNVSATNITAPLSTPPSTDDQTLTTVSYLKDLLNSMHLQRRQGLVTGQITYFNVGTTYNLETTFNITIPSWANKLRMGVQISTYGTTQGYTEFGLVSGTYTYTALNNETNNYFIVNFSYNSSNKSITVNKIMRLNDSDDSYGPSTNTLGVISITAYGNAIF